MNLSDHIEQSGVVCGLKASDKDGVLEELAALMAEKGVISDKDATLKALKEREELGSTGVGDEVAIPHAKMPDLEKVAVFLGVSKDGIDFKASDDQPVKIFFVVIAPEAQMNQHLKTLARISRLIKMTDFKELALKAENSDEIFELLKTEEAKL